MSTPLQLLREQLGNLQQECRTVGEQASAASARLVEHGEPFHADLLGRISELSGAFASLQQQVEQQARAAGLPEGNGERSITLLRQQLSAAEQFHDRTAGVFARARELLDCVARLRHVLVRAFAPLQTAQETA